MRILIDTDVTLDFLLMRQPFAQEAHAIFMACAQEQLIGYIAAITPINVFYIARKVVGTHSARNLVVDLLTLVDACTLDTSTLKMAHRLALVDFEDAVQTASAQMIPITIEVSALSSC